MHHSDLPLYSPISFAYIYLALVSFIGVLRTAYILRGCSNTPNYRTEGATNYHNASRKKTLGVGEYWKPYIALALH